MGNLLILLHQKVILFYESEVLFCFGFFFFLGGGGGGHDLVLLWASCSENRIWALMKSNGHNINRNGLYDP